MRAASSTARRRGASISYSATRPMDSPTAPRADLDPLMRRALAPGGRVVMESSPDRPLALELPLARERAYGDTLIRIYAREEAG